MRSIWKTLTLATGVIALSGAAMAADIVRPPPAAPKPIIVAPRVYNWNGWYVGVQGGWDTNALSTPSGGVTYKSTASGGIAGIYGGLNVALAPNWLWGVDASINWDGARATTTTPATPAFSAGPQWKGFIRGRVGWTADRILIYATGGAAVMGYKVTSSTPGIPGSATPWGWTAGLGVDFAVTDQLVARFDWAYQRYAFNLSNTTHSKVNDNANTFMVGLALKL